MTNKVPNSQDESMKLGNAVATLYDRVDGVSKTAYKYDQIDPMLSRRRLERTSLVQRRKKEFPNNTYTIEMAPFPLFFASALVLAYLGFVPRFTAAQGVPCQGYGGLPGATTNCYIDPSTGSELEMGVVAVGDCAQVTLLATAIYTGVDALVTAVASPEIDVGPPATNENDEAYLYFDFPVAYSDIANDSLFTYILVYVTEGATGTLADGTSTINKVSTLVYTAITDTVISTTDTTKSEFQLYFYFYYYLGGGGRLKPNGSII